MTRELDPVKAEAYKSNPNWMVVAQRISEQDGCGDFPMSSVEEILNNPGELIVTPANERRGVFTIGALVASQEWPFSAVADNDGVVRSLKIEPAKREIGRSGAYMYAAREIAIATEATPSLGLATWMGPGIPTENLTLTSDIPKPGLAVGADQINEMFRLLAENPEMYQLKPRVLGALFHVARLAIDFDATVPAAPNTLYTEIVQAQAYYTEAAQRALAVQHARQALGTLISAVITQRSPRPAIFYDRPLDLPSAQNVSDALNRLGPYPTEDEIKDALKAYREVRETLTSLTT